jgi:hypothetical protein
MISDSSFSGSLAQNTFFYPHPSLRSMRSSLVRPKQFQEQDYSKIAQFKKNVKDVIQVFTILLQIFCLGTTLC